MFVVHFIDCSAVEIDADTYELASNFVIKFLKDGVEVALIATTQLRYIDLV